jgi:hypothetical protein
MSFMTLRRNSRISVMVKSGSNFGCSMTSDD